MMESVARRRSGTPARGTLLYIDSEPAHQLNFIVEGPPSTRFQKVSQEPFLSR